MVRNFGDGNDGVLEDERERLRNLQMRCYISLKFGPGAVEGGEDVVLNDAAHGTVLHPVGGGPADPMLER
jgi:hypothetical protein